MRKTFRLEFTRISTHSFTFDKGVVPEWAWELAQNYQKTGNGDLLHLFHFAASETGPDEDDFELESLKEIRKQTNKGV